MGNNYICMFGSFSFFAFNQIASFKITFHSRIIIDLCHMIGRSSKNYGTMVQQILPLPSFCLCDQKILVLTQKEEKGKIGIKLNAKLFSF